MFDAYPYIIYPNQIELLCDMYLIHTGFIVPIYIWMLYVNIFIIQDEGPRSIAKLSYVSIELLGLWGSNSGSLTL